MGTLGTNTLVSVITPKSSEFIPIWKQGCSDVISQDQIITVRGRFQPTVTRKCLWKRKKKTKTGVVMHMFNSNTPGAGRTLWALGQPGPQRNRETTTRQGRPRVELVATIQAMSRITSKPLEVVKRQGRILSSLELWNTKFLVSQPAFVILLWCPQETNKISS